MTVTPSQLQWVLNQFARVQAPVAEVLQNAQVIQQLVALASQPHPIGAIEPVEARPEASAVSSSYPE